MRTKRWIGGAALGLAIAAGCKQAELAPRVGDDLGGGGTGGVSGGGGAAGTGGALDAGDDEGAAGSGGASGTGGASGSGGAGGTGGTGGGGGSGGSGGSGGGALDAGAYGRCGALDPTRVYLLGNLVEGDGRDAIAELSHPELPCVGLATHDEWATKLLPGGGVAWKHWNDDVLFSMRADGLVYDSNAKIWSQPSAPEANDVKIATPPCDDPDAGAGVDRFLVSPDDGTVVFRCKGEPSWREADGTAMADGVDLVALGVGGLRLAASTPGSSKPAVIADSGAVSFVTGLGFDFTSQRVAVRAVSDGFWIAGHVTSTSSEELWHVDAAGAATRVGAFASAPTGAATSVTRGALDAAGHLFQFGTDTATPTNDIVVERPLEPAAATIAYTEQGLPDDDFGVTPPVVRVRIHISGLITGP